MPRHAVSQIFPSREPPPSRILCVEQDPQLQRVFTVLCTAPGTIIECVNRADLALRLLQTFPTAYTSVVIEESAAFALPLPFETSARDAGFTGQLILLSTPPESAPRPLPTATEFPPTHRLLHPIDFRTLRQLACTR